MRVSFKLLRRVARGEILSRREKRMVSKKGVGAVLHVEVDETKTHSSRSQWVTRFGSFRFL